MCDTAGEEKYRALTPLYYREANGVILVFDLTKKESFSKVQVWLDEVKSVVKLDDINFIICANKADLVDKIQVNEDEIKAFSEDNGIKYYLISAKTGSNVNEAYYSLVENIFLNSLNTKSNRTYTKKKSIKVKGETTVSNIKKKEKDKNGNCC